MAIITLSSKLWISQFSEITKTWSLPKYYTTNIKCLTPLLWKHVIVMCKNYDKNKLVLTIIVGLKIQW